MEESTTSFALQIVITAVVVNRALEPALAFDNVAAELLLVL